MNTKAKTPTPTPTQTWVRAPKKNVSAIRGTAPAQAVSAMLGKDGKKGFQQLDTETRVTVDHLTPVTTVSASVEGDEKLMRMITKRNPNSTINEQISIYGPEKSAEDVVAEKMRIIAALRKNLQSAKPASSHARVLKSTSPRSSRGTMANAALEKELQRQAEEMKIIRAVDKADLPSRWSEWHNKTQEWREQHGEEQMNLEHRLQNMRRENEEANARLERLQIKGGTKYIKSKRKVKVIKKDVLGKDRNVYKFVGNKKEYIKYKNEFVLLKKYKEIQKKKTKSKKTKK